jgi:hypothetical protein
VALVVGMLAIATVVGIAVLWPDGEQAVEAAPTSGSEPVQAEVTQVTQIPCQAPQGRASLGT